MAFCVILGPENVYLDTKIFFLNQLETEMIKHKYSDGHFGKMPRLTNNKFAYLSLSFYNPWPRKCMFRHTKHFYVG